MTAKQACTAKPAEIEDLRERVAALEGECARLRDSERMYRFSAEIGGRLVWRADPAGQVTHISRLFSAVMCEDDEALKIGWANWVHPDDIGRITKTWADCLQTGEPLHAEFRAVLPDGSTRMALSRAVAVRDEDGIISGWLGSTEDVHDEWEADQARASAEQKLRESEELHRFTLELTQQIVWSVEPDGTGLVLSPRYLEITGMDPDADPSLSIHEEDRERVQANWEASRAGGEPYGDVCRLVTRDGGHRHFRLRAAPMRDAAGEIVRWYGVSENVHEEHVAEQARREIAERYRLVANATSDTVWDYDIEGDAIEWGENSLLETELGDDRTTPLSWWSERLHPQDRERVEASLAKLLASDKDRFSGTYRFRRADGSYAELLDQGFIIRDAAGRPVRAVGAISDISERSRAETDLRRTQAELIHLSRLGAMGAMASTLAHEINQPLGAVTNYVAAARRIAAEQKGYPGTLDASLEGATLGANRVAEILKRMRELVSGGQVRMASEVLPKIIAEANVLALVDADTLGIVYREMIDPAATWVKADRVQVQQVLINLVRNAIEAMAGSGRRELTIATREDKDMVVVSVADTGPGIAPEHFDHLFSQFMTTKSEGLGLGLPISRTIVELHGGRLWAENRPEGGAVFRFTLPRAEPSKKAKA
ncbi:MAG: PAS domain-containing sensor histidine kinase [Sphingosinicella sp.]